MRREEGREERVMILAFPRTSPAIGEKVDELSGSRKVKKKCGGKFLSFGLPAKDRWVGGCG